MKWWMIEGMLMAPEGGGEQGGGSGGEGGNGGEGGEEKTLDELKAELEEAKNSNKKLEAKRDEILTEQKNLKAQLKNFDGLDPEKMRNLQKQLEENEELRLLADGKAEEVIKRRTERLQAEHQSQLEQMKKQLEEKDQSLSTTSKKMQELIIDNSAVTAFISEGGRDSAVEDIKLRAARDFKVEDGEAIMRDDKGEIVRGKSGPITWPEWVNELREKAPHLFGESNGANSNGNRKNNQSSGLQGKLEAARAAGNIDEMRRIKKLMRKGQSES